MATSTVLTNKPINPRGDDNRPVDSYNRASLYSGKALDFDGGNDSIDTDGFSMTGANASFVWILKADASSGFIFDANPSRFAIGDNGQNTFSIYTNADGWHEFADYPDYVNTYFMSVVVEGTSAKAYVNGKPFGVDGTITAQDFSTWTQSSIMGRYTNDGGFWNGQLSGFKIFNTALTAAQVADLYNNPEKIVPTGVADSALKLWLPMMEGAGTTAYDGSPAGFVEDIVTGFTNGTIYPLDSFTSNDDDITTAIKTSGFGGCVSNGHYYTNGQKVKVKFTYQKNSGDDLRVLLSSVVTGAGTAKSDIQYISESGEFEHTFTMTADGIAYLQLGTGSASDSIDAVITDVYVSPYKSASHGTISGATWTHGIGAPVAQTAVIDWNKGTNMLSDSNKFDGVWSKVNGATISSTRVDGPYDEQGWTLNFATNNDSRMQKAVTVVSGTTYVFSIWGRVTSGTKDVRMGAVGQLSTKTFTTTWQRFEVSGSAPGTTVYPQLRKDNDEGAYSIEIYGASFEKASSAGPYVPTPVAAQTSDVLLPQGLTTGRDITGVNLFENVRKQGALNLDGNSWAEVHDNGSLDFGTGEFTLEAWVKVAFENVGSTVNVILSLGGSAISYPSIYTYDGGIGFYYNGYNANTKAVGGWTHVVAVYNGTNAILYFDAVQKANNPKTAVDITNALVKYIGRDSNTTRNYQDQIAQPRIYNRALTASEVLNNYNATKTQYQ